MSGGPTAYRLIGSGVTALCFSVIFRRVFLPERSDRRQLSSSSPRQLVDQVVCLCLVDVISEGQQFAGTKVCGQYGLELVKYEYGLEYDLFKRSLINLLNLQSNASRKGMALVPIFISMMTQMVDTPNTTPQYLSRQKTLTFKVLLFLSRQDHGFDPPCGSHQLLVFLNLKKCSLRSSATRIYLGMKDILGLLRKLLVVCIIAMDLKCLVSCIGNSSQPLA